MEVLRDIRHPHLVRVVGICLKRRCIVYEYMVNGSLADYLSHKNDTSPLLWHSRVRIDSEVFSALHHLHSLKPNEILHCSLKPGNILLDEFYSKISDVGIGRLLSKVSFIQAITYYMDPDYLRTDKFTDKSDVYSLGIIILRLLTGKRACGLVSKVTTSLESKQLDDLLDPSAEWPSEQAFQLQFLPFVVQQPIHNIGLISLRLSMKFKLLPQKLLFAITILFLYCIDKNKDRGITGSHTGSVVVSKA